MKYKYALLGVLTLCLAGCSRPQSGTPAEDEAQEERMRTFLNNSSPRNMNQQPKAVPEFRKNFNVKGSSTESNSDNALSDESYSEEAKVPE
jgi:hypothetical protein